jgi:uncharacterized protein YabN with tetrapyrrole methylase and pyrophosphatase domain
LEEVCEVLEALDAGDYAHLEEELGDVMIHILFQSDIAWRNDTFDIASVMRKATEKLQRRHPHVFKSDKINAKIGEKEVEDNWEQIKRAESGSNSILKSFPPQLSAIIIASSIQKRFAKLGLTPVAEPFFDVSEKLRQSDAQDAERNAGDMLFALIWELTRAGIEPESALRQRVANLKKRITQMEQKTDGKPLDSLNINELKKLYSEHSD